MGVGDGAITGCANPITLPDLCFALEMATFELVTQHIAWVSIFNIPPHVEKDALPTKLKYQSDTFYDLFLFITSIWTYSMQLFLKEDVDTCFIATETCFLEKKYCGRGL